VKIALAIFIIQLILNILWSAVFFGLKSPLGGLIVIALLAVFFGLKSPLGGLIVIALLWVAILLTILSFFRLSRAAGLLLLPYILWVSFAAVLNGAILVLNP
jgi:benzodiazapine receptor